MSVLEFILLKDGARPPERATQGSAAIDLYLPYEVQIWRDQLVTVELGVAVRLSSVGPNVAGLLMVRSSAGAKGLMLANNIGLIDPDYRGELQARLMYTQREGHDVRVTLPKGARVLQLLLVPFVPATLKELPRYEENWNDTARGAGGFGSTGE